MKKSRKIVIFKINYLARSCSYDLETMFKRKFRPSMAISMIVPESLKELIGRKIWKSVKICSFGRRGSGRGRTEIFKLIFFGGLFFARTLRKKKWCRPSASIIIKFNFKRTILGFS